MRLQNLSDGELLDLLRESNNDAMTEIYNRYWRKLLTIAYNLTRNKSAAQEVVQEIMIKLWDRRETLEIESLAKYLAIAVRYSVYRSICREKRRAEIFADNFSEEKLDHNDEHIYASFLQAHIDRIVDTLPEKCRLVFKYSRSEGKTIREISEIMDVSEKTTEAHLTKALKSLRFSLKHAGWLTLALVSYFF